MSLFKKSSKKQIKNNIEKESDSTSKQNLCPHCGTRLFGNPIECYKCHKTIKHKSIEDKVLNMGWEKIEKLKQKQINLKYKELGLLSSNPSKCPICSTRSNSACKIPFSEEEISRQQTVSNLFFKMDPDTAIEFLTNKEGWDHNCARNCVHMLYPSLEQKAGHKPYK